MPPTDWPNPPLFSYLLFENPWPLAIALLVVAVLLFMIGAQRASRRTQQCAAIPILLAVAAPFLAGAVETDLERLDRQTRELAHALVPPFDEPVARSLVHETVNFYHWDREALLGLARTVSDRVTVTDYGITNVKAKRDSQVYAKTYVAIVGRARRSRGAGTGQPFRTRWLLNWMRQDDGAWLLTAIDRMTIDDRDAEDLLRRFSP